MKRITSILVGTSLITATGIAAAAVGAHTRTTTVTYTPLGSEINDAIVGSDTLNGVMDSLLASMLGAGTVHSDGYHLYLGLGSSAGERILQGGQGPSGEPNCSPNDSNGGIETNPGCLEIAPMSRELQAGICDDDHDNWAGTGGWAGATGTNGTAEGMAICKDGIVVITDNTSLAQYGVGGAGGGPDCDSYGWGGAAGSYSLSVAGTSNTGNSFPDRGVGSLRSSGIIDLPTLPDYTIGGGTLTASTAWKDVLRIVYTGCDNDDGTCAGASSGTTRVSRCNSELRNTVVNNWSNIFEGDDCNGAQANTCATGLRRAYRRDDASGTTGFFLEALGVAFNTATNLANRTQVVQTLTDAIQAIPDHLSYCDGGHAEGFIPTNTTGTTTLTARFDFGDPIRKNCRAEDDLCAFDNRAPIVRAIKSTFTPDALDALSGFPKFQCTQGAFARKNYIATGTALPICPDGTKPSLAGCKFPYYTNDGGVTKNFDCLNERFSTPLTASSADGRSYNFVMHQIDGTVRMASGTVGAPNAMPHIASWRENMALLDPLAVAGKEFVTADYVCREVDATRTIGCVVGKTTCTIGFAGREAAYSTANTYHLAQEPAKVFGLTPNNADLLSESYGIARNLWINASHGFENLSDDCAARGGTTNDCIDELAVANAFYNTTDAPGNLVGDLCTANGFVPLPEIICKGATGSAGCGAPTTQVKTECEPNGTSAAP